MSANDKAGAKPMPVTGSGCGIRPSEEAMDVGFGVDFSQAKHLLPDQAAETEEHESPSSESTVTETTPHKSDH